MEVSQRTWPFFALAVMFGVVFLWCAIPDTADALARTNLLSHSNDTLNEVPLSDTTSAFTVPTNSLVVAVVSVVNGQPGTDVRTGLTVSSTGGLQWTKRANAGQTDGSTYTSTIEMWTAIATTSKSITLTLQHADAIIGAAFAQVLAYNGYNPRNPFGVSTSTIGLSPTDGAASMYFTAGVPKRTSGTLAARLFVPTASIPTAAPGRDWTELYDQSNSFGNLETMERVSSSSPQVAWSDVRVGGSSEYLGVTALALEINFVTGFPRPPNNLGLIGYWSFEEGVGTRVSDFSGNGNSGLLGTEVGALPVWVGGKVGKALLFNETTDNNYINMGDINAMDGLTRVTVSAWVKSAFRNANGDTGMVQKSACTGAGGDGPFELFQSADAAEFVVYDGGTATGVSNIDDGNWHHLVGMYDGSDVSIWVDGVRDGFTNIGSITLTSTANAFGISGYCSGTPFSFNGTIDEVRVYNRALSTSTIQALYGRRTGSSGGAQIGASTVTLQASTTLVSGLVGHWTFDGADITTVVSDRSGLGNNGYLVSVATSAAKVQGKLGQALTFTNGSAERVDAGSASSLDNLTQKTVCAWIYPRSFSGFITSKRDTSTSWGWGFYLSNSDGGVQTLYFQAAFDGAGMAFWRANAGAVTLNQWNHVCVVYDQSSGSNNPAFYANGLLRTTTAYGPPVGNVLSDADARFLIGNFNDLSSGFDGRIDDVHYYNRFLSATEVKQLYNLGQTQLKP